MEPAHTEKSFEQEIVKKEKEVNRKPIIERITTKEYQEDNDINLSDLDEDQKKELFDLEK